MAGNDSFRLIVRRGPQPNQTFDLDKDVVTLGRDITNDIVINDPEVSRHHLRFARGADGYNMEDLGSTNGTFVNGQRMTGVRPLNRGDMVGLGETVTLGYDVARPPMQSPPSSGSEPTMSGPAPQPQQPSYQPPSPQQPAPQAPPDQQGYDPQGQRFQQEPSYDYGQQYAEPQQPDYGYGGAPQAPPGYDYDPYAIREDDSNNTLRWVAIGCAIIAVFCCCSSVIAMVIIDARELWYDIPIIKELAPLFESIAKALGFI
jgi:pSer/pThr/pTyr-binding forkhead associated (FHA) protein